MCAYYCATMNIALGNNNYFVSSNETKYRLYAGVCVCVFFFPSTTSLGIIILFALKGRVIFLCMYARKQSNARGQGGFLFLPSKTPKGIANFSKHTHSNPEQKLVDLIAHLSHNIYSRHIIPPTTPPQHNKKKLKIPGRLISTCAGSHQHNKWNYWRACVLPNSRSAGSIDCCCVW